MYHVLRWMLFAQLAFLIIIFLVTLANLFNVFTSDVFASGLGKNSLLSLANVFIFIPPSVALILIFYPTGTTGPSWRHLPLVLSSFALALSTFVIAGMYAMTTIAV